jgi:flagellar biosynthesis/type III secretory pathway M-ring protein FliF/YscJ
MIALLRFILIAFLVLTILGYISRFLLRIFLKRQAKKMNNQQEESKGQKVGDAYIKGNPPKEKVVDKNVGDYVDFEEIDTK